MEGGRYRMHTPPGWAKRCTDEAGKAREARQGKAR